MTAGLSDSHLHLTLCEEGDREPFLQRARQAGVELLVSLGASLENSRAEIAAAEGHPGLYTTVGIHPWFIGPEDVETRAWEGVRSLARSSLKVVAIGEIGLDFKDAEAPREVQVRLFREQLRVARDLGLPVVIHDREAHRETFRILTEEQGYALGGVLHDFSRDPAVAEIGVGMGFYIALDGVVTWRDREAYRELARTIPLDRVVLESDAPAPYAPQPHRGGKNEPAFLAEIAAEVAALRGMPVEAVAAITTANVRRAYRIPGAP